MKGQIQDLKVQTQKMNDTIEKNYSKLEEFYVYQKEYNTAMEIDRKRMADRMKVVEGKLLIFWNQIARNTADIEEIKQSA